MRVDAFEFRLPAELVAQRPAEEREHARLMVLAAGDLPEHRRVAELPELVPCGTLVVVNDTRVLPARLVGHRTSGGRAEILLLRREDGAPRRGPDVLAGEVWRALGRASKPLRPGTQVAVSRRGSDGAPPALLVRVLRRSDDGLLEVALSCPSGERVDDAIRACGHVPLPPYVRRPDDPDDAARYQTVYARHDGAVAAPTAGLHLTHGLLDRLRARGCEIASVTLHVGAGTFLPVEVDDLDAHPMHAARCIVPAETREAVARARSRGAPVLAVGTTTARALETAADRARPGHVEPYDGDTRLLIQPGYAWKTVDGLLTNFHLPRSTLLAMVCALGGTGLVLGAYAAAVDARYRFYSYGDAMLLWRRA